jgi:hypothetical protein
MKKEKNFDYKERRINLTKLVAVFSMTVLIFMLGLIVGNNIVNSKQQTLLETEESLKLDLIDLELQEKITQSNPCSNYVLYTLGEKIDDLAGKLVLLEGQLGKTDERVIALKKPYTLLIVRHYLLINERIGKCNENYTVVLFFYSNNPKYIDNSEKEGYVLSYFSKKYGTENIRVYSIDSDIDLGVVYTLKEVYNVTEYPTVVINDKKFSGFHSKEELEKEM